MTEVVDVDKRIAETVEAVFDYPMVADCPANYPDIMGVPGDTWYARAMNYSRATGNEVPKRSEILDENGKPYPEEEPVCIGIGEDGKG